MRITLRIDVVVWVYVALVQKTDTQQADKAVGWQVWLQVACGCVVVCTACGVLKRCEELDVSCRSLAAVSGCCPSAALHKASGLHMTLQTS